MHRRQLLKQLGGAALAIGLGTGLASKASARDISESPPMFNSDGDWSDTTYEYRGLVDAHESINLRSITLYDNQGNITSYKWITEDGEWYEAKLERIQEGYPYPSHAFTIYRVNPHQSISRTVFYPSELSADEIKEYFHQIAKREHYDTIYAEGKPNEIFAWYDENWDVWGVSRAEIQRNDMVTYEVFRNSIKQGHLTYTLDKTPNLATLKRSVKVLYG